MKFVPSDDESGDPVIINSDGSVSKVEQQTATEVITELNPPVTQGSEATFTFADDDLIAELPSSNNQMLLKQERENLYKWQ